MQAGPNREMLEGGVKPGRLERILGTHPDAVIVGIVWWPGRDGQHSAEPRNQSAHP